MKQITKLLIGVVSTALFFLAANMHAGPERGSGNRDFPKLHLKKATRGDEAISALGDNLAAVAAAYGHSPERLQGLLKDDPTLTVDQDGRLLYTHELELPPELAAIPTDSSPTNADPLALGNAFALHSRPGASRMIYLNFTGCTIAGTAWNANFAGGASIVCAPFDTDGVPSVFSDAEKSIIQQVWQRVAEDYASFDVDVTTAYPGADALTRSSSTDANYGMFVVITPTSGWFGGTGGGVSYVGCFDDVADYYKPNFVFANNLLNDPTYIAEACSHEVGHALGLSHMGITNGVAYYAGQGTGDTGWAPIMGNGYYRNLTQWSRGEYANANNFEDELALITTGGLNYRPDDCGNTDATATFLPAATNLYVTGVIERNTDVDVFAFNAGAGLIKINMTPAGLGPNLDILAQLYDTRGVLLASSNPSNLLSASLSLTVPAGKYFLRVSGTDMGDPTSIGYSAYGCLGTYTVSGTVVAPATSNLPPVAAASAAPSSGYAPLVVTLDGSLSYDPDGSVASYTWSFGDGQTGSGAKLQHTYAAVGTYTAVLTVKDNQGAAATKNVTIQVQAVPPPTVRVSSIALAVATSGANKTVQATVVVTDLNNKPVSGVTINGSWSGIATGTGSASTDTTGKAVITSAKLKTAGNITFTITSLSKSGYVYDATKNLMGSYTLAVK